jgi:hypothetical protein
MWVTSPNELAKVSCVLQGEFLAKEIIVPGGSVGDCPTDPCRCPEDKSLPSQETTAWASCRQPSTDADSVDHGFVTLSLPKAGEGSQSIVAEILRFAQNDRIVIY